MSKIDLLPRSINGKWFLRIKPVKDHPTNWEINYVGRKNKDMTFRYSKMSEGIRGASLNDAVENMLFYLKKNKFLSPKKEEENE